VATAEPGGEPNHQNKSGSAGRSVPGPHIKTPLRRSLLHREVASVPLIPELPDVHRLPIGYCSMGKACA